MNSEDRIRPTPSRSRGRDKGKPSFLAGLVATSLGRLGLLILVAQQCFTFGITDVSADETTNVDQVEPIIGLVLAGGGAKGLAHVGVIKVLEEAGIHVDVVAGTSMGAIVGGIYAMGLSASELESIVESIDWDKIFVDSTPRQELTIRRKTDDIGFLADPKLRMKDGEARLPLGAIKGQRLTLELKRLTSGAAGIANFDELPIPFRAIAADIETGQEVVLGHGELAMVLRASMSVPGVFPPVVIDGRTLIDGGVINNIPVNIVRDMGADIIIVSGFVEDLGPAEELTSPLDVLNRTIDLMVLQGRRDQISSLGADDILIETHLGDLGAASFDYAEELVVLGEESARRFSDALTQIGQHSRERPVPLLADFEGQLIRRIAIDSDTKLSDDVLRARMRLQEGDRFDTAKIEQDIARIFGLDLFESVTYTVEQVEDGVEVVIAARENSAGINHLRFGLELQTDLDRDSSYNIGVRYAVPALNELNGEWRNDAVFGSRFGLLSEIYQPLDPAAQMFVGANVAFLDRELNIFRERKQIAEARVLNADAKFRVGSNVSDDLTVLAAVSRGIGRVREVTGTNLIPTENFDTATLGTSLFFDSLDNLNFPRSGALAAGRYLWSSEALGADQEYHAVNLSANGATTWGRHTFVVGQTANLTVDGDLDIGSLYELGGPFRMSGLLDGTLSGDNALFSRVIYFNEVERFGPSFLDMPLYVGATLEYGNVFQDIDDVSFDDMLLGGNLFVGADTYLGPLYFGYGYTESGSHTVFLVLGSLF